MNFLFVHDHFFVKKNEDVYSDKFPYYVWTRYLFHAESITVFSRSRRPQESRKTLSLSSGNKVNFEFAPNISSLTSFLRTRGEQKKRLKKLISMHDVIIARLPSEYGLMASKIAIELNKKLVIEVVGCGWDALWNYGSLKAKIYAPILTWRIKRAVIRAHFVSYVSNNFLQTRYPANEKALTLSASNVELPEVNDAVLKKRLQRIKDMKGKIRFGLIGSMQTRYKGVSDAIIALSKSKINNFEFHVLGDGNVDLYKSIAEMNGVKEEVFFDGVLPSGEAVFDWLDNVDVYLHPSYQEGVPRALIEAMSRGCPAIASSTGGIPELLDSNDIFTAGDTEKFISLLDSFAIDKDWLSQRAIRNFYKSKNYNKITLDKRRFVFFSKVISSP